MNISRQETNKRMSKIVCHNNTVYLSGQTPKDDSKDFNEQTRTTLERVDELLELAGTDREHMLSATIYLASMDDFAAFNEIWDQWVPDGFAPVRACVEAAMARPSILVEVCVIAAKP